jgi:dienelactone hydrolase
MNMLIKELAGLLINFRSGSAVLSCIIFLSLPALAETIEAKLPSGITSYAEFRQGTSSQPAVLSLHGFLQTHHSQPMNSLASNLAAAGYTVLSPTMSLGVNRRKQSMACEAAHTHTMDDEAGEVAFWINWLSGRGYKDIVPVGFSSTGNISLLQYNIQGSHPSIKKMILTSINPVHINHTEHSKLPANINRKAPSQGRKIARYSVGYCKNNFSATLNTYLSYSSFIDGKILDLISHATVPLEIILGSADTVLPANWQAEIIARNPRARITIVNKADHFFQGTTELDLADSVESILKTIATH